MAMVPAGRGDLFGKGHIMMARYNPETGEPDMNTATPWFTSSASLVQPTSESKHECENYCSEYKMSFSLAPMKRKNMIRLLGMGSYIGKIAKGARESGDMLGLPQRKLNLELPYEIYRCLQRESHILFGCNLKRALRLFGCNVKIRHTTKNGYWVWMK